jgi:methionyl-tRNA synthetase
MQTPSVIFYFLTINAPENRDTDFSWREFIYSHNSELLGAYGNFVNRTLKFIEKSYESKTPEGKVDSEIKTKIIQLYKEVGSLIINAHFKKSLENIFEFVRYANKYFDEQKPWIQVKEEKSLCDNTMANCIYIISNLAQLLHPFLPFSSQNVKEMLGLNELRWEEVEISSMTLKGINPLFKRIELERIEEELKRLNDGI